MNDIKKTQQLIWLSFLTTIFSGCTAPVTPPIGPAGNSIILYILLLLVIYLLWYLYKNIQNSTIDKQNDDLYSRLTQIEEELKNLKSELKGKNHDKK